MRLLGLAIGVFIIVVGAIGLVAPNVFLVVGRSVATPGGLNAIAVLRIAIGLSVALAAPASRAPRTLRVLGIVVIIAGVATPWFGVDRMRAYLDWVAMAPSFLRLVAGTLMVLGSFVVYAFRR